MRELGVRELGVRGRARLACTLSVVAGDYTQGARHRVCRPWCRLGQKPDGSASYSSMLLA